MNAALLLASNACTDTAACVPGSPVRGSIVLAVVIIVGLLMIILPTRNK